MLRVAASIICSPIPFETVAAGLLLLKHGVGTEVWCDGGIPPTSTSVASLRLPQDFGTKTDDAVVLSEGASVGVVQFS